MSEDGPDTPQDAANWQPTLTDPKASAPVLAPCVVLAALDTPVPQTLHGALHAAALSARIEHDPAMAMAEVCLLRRSARQKAADGATGEALPPLVLLSQPTDAAAEMVHELERLLPDVPVLLLQGSQLVQLAAASVPQPQVDPDEILSLLGRPDASPRESI
ncbi:MAG: hypothetical protein MK101_08850 [Phycisphaerales bacterium]|nr:hypothetical protein [Phycisphaerales bacterium]